MMETTKCNFERGDFLGKGAFGKVYTCFDKERQKKFAMKIIDLEGISERDRNNAEIEARLLTTLQHKYILHAVSVYQENETLCIVTEFCDQGDLQQFLDKRKGKLLEEERIVEWFRQICSALEFLHQKNVLHRDVKPENIYLTGKERTIKLGDLGLAKVLESSIQKASTFCGTPYYMSPEIFAGRKYNAKSDIWAMGVCVYQMTTLRWPFDVYTVQHTHVPFTIDYDQLPPIPKDKYSQQLTKVIEWMLCQDTDYRPTSTKLLQDVLFKKQQTSLEENLQEYLKHEGVCERDALEVEKKILITKTDSLYVMKREKIPTHEISGVLDGLQMSGDIDKKLRRQLDLIALPVGDKECKTVEWNFDTSLSNIHGQYGVIVLRKSEDGGYIDFINIRYKIEIEIIPECRNKVSARDRRIPNFIRMKALQRFKEEGLTAFIKVVPDIPE